MAATTKTKEINLKTYYQRFFPFVQLCQWLTHHGTYSLDTKEIAFWFSGDQFTRFQSFASPDEFKLAVKSKSVERIEIGPYYNVSPSYHRNLSCVPIAREFTIDIDINEYDNVRNCCSGAENICSKCWAYVVIAVKILNHLLRYQFGFKSLLWVFSGRRGMHCWVSDDVALKLNRDTRTSLAKYFSGDPEIIYQRFSRVDIHLSLVQPYFVSHIAETQNLLECPKTRDHLASVVDPSLTSVDSFSKVPLGLVSKMSIYCTYPRIDVPVSQQINHLLKSPFSFHPKSGLISIPIDIEEIDSFHPLNSAPSLSGLILGHPEDIEKFERALQVFNRLLVQ